MTAIEQTIKEAVEKGEYDASRADVAGSTEGGNVIRWAVYERAFLDPSFWQALEKAEVANGRKFHWLPKWHYFIDHLAQGKDAESFFATL